MKRAAVALFACAGCNSWFGLDPTHEVTPDAPPTFGTARVVYQVATTNNAGMPEPASYAPIGGLMVSAGTASGPLAPVAVAADGTIQIPSEVLAGPWRLAYAIGGGMPVEYQWQATAPVVCVPRFGRLDRTAVGAGDYVRMHVPVSYLSPRLVTTGVWTETPLPNPPGTGTGDVAFPFAMAKPLDGDLGAPEGARGDRQLVVDFRNGGSEAYGYGIEPGELVPPGTAATTVPFEPASGQPQAFGDKIVPLVSTQRFTAGLGALYTDPNSDRSHTVVGLVPSPAVPALGIDAPFIVDLGTYDGADFGSYAPVNPVELAVPRAVYLRRTTLRSPNGVKLISTLERMDLGTSDDYPRNAPTDLAVGVASHVTLDDADLMSGDNLAITSTTTTHTLAFTVMMGTADDAVVTIYRIDPTDLVPVHRYITTGTTIAIDPAVLAPGSTYVAAIELRTGYPDAAAGDYRRITYPLAASKIFAGTFRIQ